MNLISKKKSQMLYQEVVLIVFSFLIISLTLYFVLNNISGTKTTFEKSAPDFTYKFPASFVHTFLYTEVSKEDIVKLNLDENKKYYVKDIIYLNSKESEIITRKLSKEYITEMGRLSTDSGGDMHTYYKEFSKDNYDDENLITISFDQQEVPLLENSFNEKNYFYYIKQKDGKYTIIFFISRGVNEDQIGSSSSEENNGLLDKEIGSQGETTQIEY